MTQRDSIITKNYIWGCQIINFKDRNFLVRNWDEKKFLWNWKIELAKNAGYDLAWSANHEKLYLSPSKNQFLRSKFFGQKLKWKKFPWNWKIELALNAEYGLVWSGDHENYIFEPIKKSISRSKFFRQKLR